jgi:hypothetical protein
MPGISRRSLLAAALGVPLVSPQENRGARMPGVDERTAQRLVEKVPLRLVQALRQAYPGVAPPPKARINPKGVTQSAAVFVADAATLISVNRAGRSAFEATAAALNKLALRDEVPLAEVEQLLRELFARAPADLNAPSSAALGGELRQMRGLLMRVTREKARHLAMIALASRQRRSLTEPELRQSPDALNRLVTELEQQLGRDHPIAGFAKVKLGRVQAGAPSNMESFKRVLGAWADLTAAVAVRAETLTTALATRRTVRQA